MSTVDAHIEQNIYQLFMKIFILLDDSDRRFFAEYGLSTRQFWALRHLDKQRGRSMVDLSRVLFTDKSNVTSIIDRLECLQLVTRTPDPRDRRVILITLTSKGQRLRNLINEQHEARICELMNALNGSHLSALLNYLCAISEHIEAHLEQNCSNESKRAP